MLTVFGNWGSAATINCVEGTFDGGFIGGSADYILCNGNAGSVTLNPQTTSKILCIQDGSITNSTLIFNINGPCAVGGFNPPPPFGDNAFTVERTSDGFATYVQYDSNHAVNDIVNISTQIGCFEIMTMTNVNDPSIFGVITGGCFP